MDEKKKTFYSLEIKTNFWQVYTKLTCFPVFSCDFTNKLESICNMGFICCWVCEIQENIFAAYIYFFYFFWFLVPNSKKC